MISRTHRERIALLLVFACAVAVQSACGAPLHIREPLQGTLIRVADGQPVPNASVTVESWSLRMPGAEKFEPLGTYETRTDERGHWEVPGRTRLVFILPIPEAPGFGDAYTFRAPDNETWTVASWRRWTDGQRGASLRSTFEPLDRMETLLMPVLGLGFGEGQRASIHVGLAGVVLVGRRAAGLRASVTPGLDGFAADGGIVVSPIASLPFLPAIELNGRWFRPWKTDNVVGAEYGPELALDVWMLRFTVSALARRVSAALNDRHFLFGAGFGFL